MKKQRKFKKKNVRSDFFGKFFFKKKKKKKKIYIYFDHRGLIISKTLKNLLFEQVVDEFNLQKKNLNWD
jgi:predicted SpoU family rRNA methylase